MAARLMIVSQILMSYSLSYSYEDGLKSCKFLDENVNRGNKKSMRRKVYNRECIIVESVIKEFQSVFFGYRIEIWHDGT